MKKLLYFSVVVIFTLLSISCSKNNDGEPDDPSKQIEKNLIGMWKGHANNNEQDIQETLVFKENKSGVRHRKVSNIGKNEEPSNFTNEFNNYYIKDQNLYLMEDNKCIDEYKLISLTETSLRLEYYERYLFNYKKIHDEEGENADNNEETKLIGMWKASYKDSDGQYIKEELTFNKSKSGKRYQEIRISSPTSEFYSTSELKFDTYYIKDKKLYLGYNNSNLTFDFDLISIDNKNLIVKENGLQISYTKK